MRFTQDNTSRDLTVAAAMTGDRKAMESLWQEHRRWIAAVLLVHKTQEDHLDDLLQDVAMTLVSKIDTLRETGNIRAWLRTVAVNAARASARRGRSRPRPSSLEYEAEADSIEANMGGQIDEEATRLMGLSKQLPETYREPLMLRAIHGMRGKHIAQILGLTEATVETRIARARKMLRKLAENPIMSEPSPSVVALISGGKLQRGRP
ncbi:MAG: sigma-70 family RNA polymerase sigma factor [Planctomycetes bacterium]|nr:sigma-70 family RNA polymerase sigma factor [Planctomycetota bacterium]